MRIKNILYAAFATLMMLPAVGCSSDMDEVFVLPNDNVTLGGASNEIILTPERGDALVLSLYWSGDGKLSLSDDKYVAANNVASDFIEFSIDDQFESPYSIAIDKGVHSKQFLGDEFNSMLGLMNFPVEELTPLYIRIRTEVAPNVNPTYSNVLKVNAQTYRVHLNIATVLDSNGNPTTVTLYSPDENGIYTGFMGVGAWYNWFLREANNITWGNMGEDGKTFYASSDDSKWNFWFPGETGCYYTTVNTVDGWWSGLYVKNLTIAGNVNGEMTYNHKVNQWTLDVNCVSAMTAEITISGDALLYNKETTANGPALPQRVAFSGNSSDLTFGKEGGIISLDLPAGPSTLILDLTNPQAFTIATGSAAEEPEISEKLYFSGLMTWDGFDDYLSLYDESTLSYGGAQWIDSEWGYRAYTQADWAAGYKAADGASPLAGNLVAADSDGNIPAPEKGLYVMDFNMKDLSYALTKIESVTYTGLNDDWSEHLMTQSSDNPEIFTAEFVKEKETPWGVKILINNDWGLFFGGGNGVLRLGHSDATTGFDGDNALTVGETYILTVDLGKQTYSYSLK